MGDARLGGEGAYCEWNWDGKNAAAGGGIECHDGFFGLTLIPDGPGQSASMP